MSTIEGFPAAPAGVQTWEARDHSHKGCGWVIASNSLRNVGGPTIADGMTAEHAAYLVVAAKEFHGLVAKVAELRPRFPDSPVLDQIEALADAGLSIDAMVCSAVEKAA